MLARHSVTQNVDGSGKESLYRPDRNTQDDRDFTGGELLFVPKPKCGALALGKRGKHCSELPAQSHGVIDVSRLIGLPKVSYEPSVMAGTNARVFAGIEGSVASRGKKIRANSGARSPVVPALPNAIQHSLRDVLGRVVGPDNMRGEQCERTKILVNECLEGARVASADSIN